jgi:hypothetical protein
MLKSNDTNKAAALDQLNPFLMKIGADIAALSFIF